MNRLAIFDCDGTLVDSQHNICLAMEECFAAAGLDPPARERTRNVVGLSLVEAMRAMLPEAEAEFHTALAEDYKRAFQAMRARGLAEEPLYEGVAELIDRLEAEGWLLGVATGKSDRGVALCLEHHGLAKRFVTLQTADRHPSKPHPSMIEQAMADAGAAPETMPDDRRHQLRHGDGARGRRDRDRRRLGLSRRRHSPGRRRSLSGEPSARNRRTDQGIGMNSQDQEALWRNRFILINLVRIGGTIIVLLALALWQSDLFVHGGTILGFPLALVGLVVSFWGPKWLARRWREPPAA